MKIVVENISNLTDARYFSAMNVDAIIFTCSENPTLDDILELKELVDWIEGPEIILPIWAKELSDQVFSTQKVDGYYSANQQQISLNGETVQIVNNLENEITDHSKLLRLNMESSFPQKESIQMLNGILISGGEEEKVGLKAYDWYDEFFDWVEKLAE